MHSIWKSKLINIYVYSVTGQFCTVSMLIIVYFYMKYSFSVNFFKVTNYFITDFFEEVSENYFSAAVTAGIN